MKTVNKLLNYGIIIVLFGFVFVLVDLYRTRDMTRDPAVPGGLNTVSGDSVDLVELSRHKPLLIYFWATWCGPCKATSPTVQWLSGHYQVVTVALDSGTDLELQAYLQANDYDFPVVNDADYQVGRAFDVGVTPTVVVLKNGRVSSSTIGISTPVGLWLRLFFA